MICTLQENVWYVAVVWAVCRTLSREGAGGGGMVGKFIGGIGRKLRG